jgi:hypothetical protein
MVRGQVGVNNQIQDHASILWTCLDISGYSLDILWIVYGSSVRFGQGDGALTSSSSSCSERYDVLAIIEATSDAAPLLYPPPPAGENGGMLAMVSSAISPAVCSLAFPSTHPQFHVSQSCADTSGSIYGHILPLTRTCCSVMCRREMCRLTIRVRPILNKDVVFLNTLMQLVSQLLNDGESRQPLRDL